MLTMLPFLDLRGYGPGLGPVCFRMIKSLPRAKSKGALTRSVLARC